MKKTKNARLNCLSDFYCTYCGHKGIPVIRKVGAERESGHLKKLFCLYCQQERNMVEIRNKGKYTLETFEIEYNGGNFVNGERVKPYGQFIAEHYHNEMKRGKGYNGNVE